MGVMAQPDTPSQDPAYDVGHTHPNISGGWLRAATFGAMDELLPLLETLKVT